MNFQAVSTPSATWATLQRLLATTALSYLMDETDLEAPQARAAGLLPLGWSAWFGVDRHGWKNPWEK